MVVNLEVVLATFNGDLFLEEQLQSLWRQELRPDQLIVFDDGSTDSTSNILEQWQQRHPAWIKRLPPASERLGPTAAFNRLLQQSSAPYIALCDQDDVWHPERLATGLNILKQVEASHPFGSQQPLLLHSDAELINSEGRPLNRTLWQWHHYGGELPGLIELAQHNSVTGCTIILNRALLQQALPITGDAVFHDHWLALVARHKGKILSCSRPLLAHRRHRHNSSGKHPHWRGNAGLALRRWQAKHQQWKCFCARYRLPAQKSLCWWPRAAINPIMRINSLSRAKYMRSQ